MVAPIIQEFRKLTGRQVSDQDYGKVANNCMTSEQAFKFMAQRANLRKYPGVKFQLYSYMEEKTKLMKERVNTKTTNRLTDRETANVRREIAKTLHRPEPVDHDLQHTRTQRSSQRREGYTLEDKKVSNSSLAAPTAKASQAHNKGFKRQDYTVFRRDLKKSFGANAAAGPWRSNYEVSTV